MGGTMTTLRFTKAEQQEAITRLKEIIQPGDTIYTIVKQVARSGMSRRMNLYLIRDNQPIWLTRRVAVALDMGFHDESDTLIVRGCGMDMGFSTVYDLSRTLFDGNGYALNQRWM